MSYLYFRIIIENNGNLHFSPAANFCVCPVRKRDFATQTDSDGKVSLVSLLQNVWPLISHPAPLHHLFWVTTERLDSNRKSFNLHSSKLYSSDLNSSSLIRNTEQRILTVAGNSRSGGSSTRKERSMWTDTQFNALEAKIPSCGAGKRAEILHWAESRFNG